jgi:hypothetical protein
MMRGDRNKWMNAWLRRARKIPLVNYSDDSDDEILYVSNSSRGAEDHEEKNALRDYVITLRRTRRAEEQVLKDKAISEDLVDRLGSNCYSDSKPVEHLKACRCDNCRMRRAKLRISQEATERFKESSRTLSTLTSRESPAYSLTSPLGYTPVSFNSKVYSPAESPYQLGGRTSSAAGSALRTPRYLSGTLWSHAATSDAEADGDHVDYLARAYYDDMDKQADYARGLFPGRVMSALAKKAAKKQEEAVRGLLRRMTVDTPLSGNHSVGYNDTSDVRNRVRARSLSFSGAISPGNKGAVTSLFPPTMPLNRAPMPGSWQSPHGDNDSPSARRMRSKVAEQKLLPVLKSMRNMERSAASWSRTDVLSKGKPWTAYV